MKKYFNIFLIIISINSIVFAKSYQAIPEGISISDIIFIETIYSDSLKSQTSILNKHINIYLNFDFASFKIKNNNESILLAFVK
jgi:hypothetical protein